MWEKDTGLPLGWRAWPRVADWQGSDAMQVFRDSVRAIPAVRVVEAVQLRAKDAAAQRAQRIALHAARQSIQEARHGVWAAERRGIPGPELAAEIGLVPVAEFLPDRALVEPGPCLGGWGEELPLTPFAERLGVPLVHAPEAAELALRSIPVAMVIAVLGRELAA